MSAWFILDQHGTILSADANPDYTQRPEPTGIIKEVSYGIMAAAGIDYCSNCGGKYNRQYNME